MVDRVPAYIAIDVETTGLDVTNDEMLEAAVALVADDMSVIAHRSALFAPESVSEAGQLEAYIAGCDDFIQNMHTDNGLWRDMESQFNDLLPFSDFDASVSQMLADHNVNERLPLFGSSVDKIDRPMMERYLPETYANFVSYRSVDVSSVLELATRTYAVEEEQIKMIRSSSRTHIENVLSEMDEPVLVHRALADIFYSITTLPHLLDALGVPREN